jgi:hypothetical protein
MPNDVFGLNTVYDRQVESTWPESNVYGYFAGGSNPTNVCTIDRLDFSTETVSEPGSSLSLAKYRAAGFNNSEYGYVAGGTDNSGYNCVIDRLDFSNETTSLPGTNLPLGKSYITNNTSQNLNFAYISGGYGPHPGPPPTYQCIIERFDFSNEVVVSLGDKLTVARDSQCGLSGKEYGYYAGGEGINPGSSPPNTSIIERLEFSSETVSFASYLPEGRKKASPLYDENRGFICGGDQDTQAADNTYVTCTINRIDFSNNTLYNAESNLTHQRTVASSVQNSNHGYIGGGMSTSYLTSITRLDFSNNTVSIIEGTLEGRINATGFYSTKSKTHANQVKKGADIDGKGISSTYGYFAGGNFPGPTVAIIDRIDFSSHTVSAPSPSLTQARHGLAAVSNSNYGYFAGGFESNWYATIDRLDFSNETVVGPPVHGVNLTQARAGLAAVSNSNYGFYAGGERFDFECTIDRLDFSNETLAVPSVGNELTKARQFLGAVSNSNYGYFGGGRTPPTVVTIDRIDFSSETVSLPGNNLTQARSGIAGVFSSNYGYFGGGSPSVCTIDRIDFSTETVDGPPDHGSSLTAARSALAGASNSNYGYFGGGGATIDNIDFSTGTTSPAASLSQSRERLAAVSN